MSKITEIDRKLQVKHLNDLSKASVKSSIKHSQNIQTNLGHTVQITKFMKEDRAKLSRLECVIDMKQREVDELNKKNTDLLWDLSKLQLKNGKLQEYYDNSEKQLAYYTNSLKKMMKNGKDN